MRIREATTDDIDRIHDPGRNVDEFNVSDEVVTFWPKHILENCIRSETDWIVVAENGDEIVGFVIVNYSSVFKKAIIENIFVPPPHRNKGIGAKLLEFVVSKVQEKGCEYLCLLIEDGNETAINFYVKNGFNKGGTFVWMDKVLSKEFRRFK